MFAYIPVEIKSPAQLAAIHEFWDRIGDYESAEPDEYGFRSRDLRTINETLCDGFGQTGRNLVEIRRGIDDLGDRLARQNRRGRRRPGRAYDERKIDAVRQVWALANESAEAKQSLNTRMTFAVALRYGKPVLDQAGITTREEFARIRHAISCRESRARIKALEATRTPLATSASRKLALRARGIPCAPEDLPRTPVHKSGENGIISSMKNGATTLALMAAMLCGIGVFWGLESRCSQPPPTTQKLGMGLSSLYGTWEKEHFAAPSIVESYEPDRTKVTVEFEADDSELGVKPAEVGVIDSEVGEKTGVSDDVKAGSVHEKPISDHEKSVSDDVNRDFEVLMGAYRSDFRDNARQVLYAFAETPEADISSVAKGLGFSTKSVWRAIRAMKAVGLLVREGGDKGGRWIVKKAKI